MTGESVIPRLEWLGSHWKGGSLISMTLDHRNSGYRPDWNRWCWNPSLIWHGSFVIRQSHNSDFHVGYHRWYTVCTAGVASFPASTRPNNRARLEDEATYHRLVAPHDCLSCVTFATWLASWFRPFLWACQCFERQGPPFHLVSYFM